MSKMTREEAVSILESLLSALDIMGIDGDRYNQILECIRILAPEPRTEPSIDDFVREVERRAENNMMKTGKLEGAHYAAMKQYQAELSALPMPKGTATFEKGEG